MTQRFSLYEDLSIRENLDFVARLYAMDRRRERVAEALERLGLANRKDQLAGALSGGWKQRLALDRRRAARAQAAAARRAHRRRRPQGAARVLGRDPPAGGRRHDRPGQHPLHGRGRALPPHRLHLLRPAADRGHHRARCWRHPTWSPGVPKGRGSTPWPTSCAGGPGSRWWPPSARPCMSAAPTGRRSRPRSRPGAPSPVSIWREIPPSLEDVFIHLMSGTPGQLRMTGRWFSFSPPVGRDREGVHPDAPGPAHLRHDGGHPADAAHPVRLRHQHRPQAPADRRALPTTRATSPAASSRRCRTPATIRGRAIARQPRRGRPDARRWARPCSRSPSRPGSRATCCAATARNLLVEGDASDPGRHRQRAGRLGHPADPRRSSTT